MHDKNGVPGLLSKCKTFGIQYMNDKRTRPLLRAIIETNVTKFWQEKHAEEGTSFHLSDCFQADRQTIDRSRKVLTTKTTKAAFAKALQTKGTGALDRDNINFKKKVLTAEAAVEAFPDTLYTSPDGQLRCKCDNKGMANRDHAGHVTHLGTKRHLKYVKGKQAAKDLLDSIEKVASEDGIVTGLKGQRRGVSEQDKAFRLSCLRAILACGITPAIIDKLRPWLENRTGMSLENSQCLKRNYLRAILKLEVDEQCKEVLNKTVSLIWDNSPRLGDVFALLVRFVIEEEDIIKVVQRLISLQFVVKNMTEETLSGAVARALSERRLAHRDVVGVAVDACSTNTAAHRSIENAYQVQTHALPVIYYHAHAYIINHVYT